MRLEPVILVLCLAACGPTPGPSPESTRGEDTALSSSTTVSTPAQPEAVGHCVYTNLFSQGEECRSYLGDGWTQADAEADCAAPPIALGPGQFTADAPCGYADELGRCAIDEGEDLAVELVFPGSDPAECDGVAFGCGLAGGTFVGAGVCDGQGGGGVVFGQVPFEPFEQVCVTEPTADDGEVCTWNAISGTTEEGFRYLDYGDCDAVRTQRPYVPYGAAEPAFPDDGRLDDPVWAEEFAWVTAQFEATACVCCHSDTAPDGAAGWFLEDGPIWTDGASDYAIAMFAGDIDSSAFGAFSADDNHGFDRSVTGVPTTDIPRMQAFMRGELARRGLVPEDFAAEGPWGGPLVDQLLYEPAACGEGQGLDAAGRLQWTGGDVRYLYVLEEGAANPTVPPNLDLPDGTLWRVDVLPEDEPLGSGVPYGRAPARAIQAWPLDDAAPELVPGKRYYLVALADIIQPVTRCLFTAP